MKFNIEQVAICPVDPKKAIALLTELGAGAWAHDHVVANGKVYNNDALADNEADLAFNYELGVKEFEVLHYTDGPNWMGELSRVNSVSHLGMHCTEDELSEFKVFFAKRGINIAQEVNTKSHTNQVIDGKRLYHYCIFDTKEILGTDLKFIVRRML